MPPSTLLAGHGGVTWKRQGVGSGFEWIDRNEASAAREALDFSGIA